MHWLTVAHDSNENLNFESLHSMGAMIVNVLCECFIVFDWLESDVINLNEKKNEAKDLG